MIFTQWKVCLGGCILVPIILTLVAFYTYRENTKREPDDPQKRFYHPFSPWLTPITPFFWLARYVFLAPWSILFGLFLIIFPFMLILLRPISPDDPIKRFILKIGNGILKINTSLLHALGFQQVQTFRPFK